MSLVKAVSYAGLDPYAGYLHADRPGKPSLVLDLMEEFRQQVVDRTVITLLSKRVLLSRMRFWRLSVLKRGGCLTEMW